MTASKFIVPLAVALAALLAPPSLAGPARKADPYAVLLAPTSTCAGQTRGNASPSVQGRALTCLVNYARRRHGLASLRTSGRLNRSSRFKAQDIVRCNSFSHTPCGQAFDASFRRAGYLSGRVSFGENIFWGTVGLASPRQAMIAWLHSDGHRQNLLTASWRDFGLARIQARSLFGYGAAVVWVNEFGRRG